MAAFLRAIAALSLILCTARASASPGYPAVLDKTLGLACPPTCDLCHVKEPGFATVNTRIGITMRRADLSCCDDGDLERVIAEMMESAPDSDGDEVADLDELVAGTDPNEKEGSLACKVEASYDGIRVLGVSCAARPAATGDAAPLLALFSLASLLVAVRRRR